MKKEEREGEERDGEEKHRQLPEFPLHILALFVGCTFLEISLSLQAEGQYGNRKSNHVD